MQSIFQSFLLRLAFDKFLYSLQLVFTACLKSAGVVENIAIVVCEDEFVVNVVLATLQVAKQDPQGQLSPTIMSRSNLCCGVELNLDRTMRSKAPSGTRTYLIASSLWIKPVDLRTLRRIANPL